MPDQTTDLSTVLARLERVERENRRLKRAGSVLLLAVCVFLLMGQSQANRTLDAERFVLTDQAGKVRAVLGSDGKGSSLKFYGASDLEFAEISTDGLQIYTKKAHMIFGEDLLGNMALYISDEVGGGNITLGKVPIYGGNGKPPALGLIVIDKKSGVFLNAGDAPRLEVGDDQGFLATLGHSELEVKKTGKTLRTSAASLVLSGKDGVLWSAP